MKKKIKLNTVTYDRDDFDAGCRIAADPLAEGSVGEEDQRLRLIQEQDGALVRCAQQVQAHQLVGQHVRQTVQVNRALK
jgi:hypothetical protein